MKLDIPEKSRKKVEERVELVSNRINKAILRSLLKKNPKYFNQLSRDLSKAKLGSRRAVCIHMKELEEAGLIQSRMEQIEYGKEKHLMWVRKYWIPELEKSWIRTLLGG